MLEGQLLDELRKCDDDASMEPVAGEPGVYRVVTSLPLHSMTMEGISIQSSPPTTQEEEEENIFATAPDNVAILMVKYLFMALAFYAFCALLFSLPLYMWQVPQAALITLQVLGGVGMLLSYSGMCVMHDRVMHWPRLSLCALVIWFCSLTLMLSAAAGLSHNLAPFQLLTLWWVQSVALSIYLQWMGPNNHHVSRLHASLCMAVGTLAVWGLSIVTFVRDSDWLISLALLALAFGSLLYSAHEMQRAIEEKRYAKTRIDMISALINFYTDVPVALCCASH
jgi:hypothetical protein